MIVSASYRTDIPAYYAQWFLKRLRAGYCLVRNPYSGRYYRVSLDRKDVSAFVFWTRNLGPFTGVLEEVRNYGIPFIVQYSITCYPQILERRVIPLETCVEHMRCLAQKFGSRVAVWRYDTIILTSLTPTSYHLERFCEIAQMLEGYTDEVVVSWANMYKKTVRNLRKAAEGEQFSWFDPPDEEKIRLLLELEAIAREKGMELTVCGQEQYLRGRLKNSSCVDAGRISSVAGRMIEAAKRPHRQVCGCYESRDIGEYDTCPHGCVFCYAVDDRDTALLNYLNHDPDSDSLIPLSKSRLL